MTAWCGLSIVLTVSDGDPHRLLAYPRGLPIRYMSNVSLAYVHMYYDFHKMQ